MKSKRTRKIEAHLQKKLNGSNVQLIPEYPVGQYCRVDFCMLIKEKDTIVDAVGLEIKVTPQDFHTGYGQNFVFRNNYFVVPNELVVYAIRYKKRKKLDDVGILAVSEGGTITIVEYSKLRMKNTKDYCEALLGSPHWKYIDER